MTSGIYSIKNKINKKEYIGQSIDVERRWKNHCERYGNDYWVQDIDNDIHKYGKDNFIFSIIEECSSDKLLEREKFWIKKKNTIELGYNKKQGRKRTDQEIEEMSKIKNTSGFFRVYIDKKPDALNNIIYVYHVREKGVDEKFSNIEIYDLQQKVLKNNYPFKCFTKEAEKQLKLSKIRCTVDHYHINKGGFKNNKQRWELRKNNKKIKSSVDRKKLEKWIFNNCSKNEKYYFLYHESLKYKN